LRRSRWRTLVKWTGTLACGLILVAAAACLRWWYVGVSDGENWAVGIVGGSVSVLWGGWVADSFDAGGWVGPVYPTWQELAAWWGDYGSLPTLGVESTGSFFVYLPLWIPFVLIGLPTAWLWRRDRRRPRPGCCAACGYDLTGNVSGRCPECGTAVPSAK